MAEEERLKTNERIRLWYQANKERLQARRRELYDAEKDKEYYQKMKENPSYKAKRAAARMRSYYKTKGYGPETKEDRMIAKHRQVGKTLADRYSKHKTIRTKPKDTAWMAAIPDLSTCWQEF